MVNVDNGSTNEWQLLVDGQPWCALKPYVVIGFQLSTGNHEFRVLEGTKEVDRIKAKVKGDHVTVVNPGALSVYLLTTATYVSMFRSPASADGPRREALRGQRVCYANYGLLQELPSAVKLKDGVPQPAIVRLFNRASERQETRSKLSKPEPETIGMPEAAAILTGNLNVYEGTDELRGRALGALKPGVDQPEIRKLVASHLETALARPAFEALGKYQTEITDAQALSWLAKAIPSDDKTGATARVGLAAQLLVQRELGAEIEKRFRELPETNQLKILESLKAAPLALRKAVIARALEVRSQSLDAKALALIIQKDFTLDDEFNARMESYQQGLTKEAHRKMWTEQWGNKLCHAAAELPREWVLPRLADIARQESGNAFMATHVLIELGAEDRLAPLFAGKSPEWQAFVLKTLSSRRRTESQISDPTLKMAMEGLQHPAKAAGKGNPQAVFKEAFHLLCDRAYDRPEIREQLKATFTAQADALAAPAGDPADTGGGDEAAEPSQREHARLVKDLEEVLTRAVFRQPDVAAPEACLKLALEAPCRAVVAKAFERLFHTSTNKAGVAQIAPLAQQFPGLTPVKNQIWILELLGHSAWLKQGNPEFGVSFDAIFNLGFASPDPQVRAAAVQGRLADTHLKPGTESEAILKAIQAETDPSLRGGLMRTYNLWSLRFIHDLTRKTETREDGIRQLAEMAVSGDDAVAMKALRYLRSSSSKGMEGVIGPVLVQVFERARTEQCKIEVFSAAKEMPSATRAGLFEKGLADSSRTVRRVAAETLRDCWRKTKDPSAAELLKAAAARETDPDVKRRLEGYLQELR